MGGKRPLSLKGCLELRLDGKVSEKQIFVVPIHRHGVICCGTCWHSLLTCGHIKYFLVFYLLGFSAEPCDFGKTDLFYLFCGVQAKSPCPCPILPLQTQKSDPEETRRLSSHFTDGEVKLRGERDSHKATELLGQGPLSVSALPLGMRPYVCPSPAYGEEREDGTSRETLSVCLSICAWGSIAEINAPEKVD